jgi:hypothetical protein
MNVNCTNCTLALPRVAHVTYLLDVVPCACSLLCAGVLPTIELIRSTVGPVPASLVKSAFVEARPGFFNFLVILAAAFTLYFTSRVLWLPVWLVGAAIRRVRQPPVVLPPAAEAASPSSEE